MSSPGNFDRVINQATLVMEDRIRKKSKLEKNDIGVALVNKALNSDSTKSKLIISDNADYRRGICDICRGIMAAYRNDTHHYLSSSYTREDALIVCSFINGLLKMINAAKLST